MIKQKDTPSKISGYAAAFRDSGVLTVIIIVNVDQADYIPAGIYVRQKITPFIFTSEVKGEDLLRLDNDPRVISVEVCRKMSAPI